MKLAIAVLLSLAVSLQSTVSYAVSPVTKVVRLQWKHQAKYTMVSRTSARSPKISENEWVLYLFGTDDKGRDTMANLYNRYPGDPVHIVQRWNQLRTKLIKKDYGKGGVRERDRNRKKMEDLYDRYETLAMVQDQLNLAYEYGQELNELINNNQFDEAFRFAEKNGLIRLIIQPLGLQALYVNEFSAERMRQYFLAASRNYGAMQSDGLPYVGREWASNKHAIARANNNYRRNAKDEGSQYPNLAYFNSEKEKDSKLVKFMNQIVVPVVVGIVSAGAGSALAGGISTLSGGAVSSTNTALNVVTNATSSAAISTAQGGKFGDSLIDGVVGGVVGTVAGHGVKAAGVDKAVNRVIRNQRTAQYVTGTVTGTISGAALNGGDLNSAFTGAAMGTAQGVLINGVVNHARRSNSSDNRYIDPSKGTQQGLLEDLRFQKSRDNFLSNPDNRAFGTADTTGMADQAWKNANARYDSYMDQQAARQAQQQYSQAQRQARNQTHLQNRATYYTHNRSVNRSPSSSSHRNDIDAGFVNSPEKAANLLAYHPAYASGALSALGIRKLPAHQKRFRFAIGEYFEVTDIRRDKKGRRIDLFSKINGTKQYAIDFNFEGGNMIELLNTDSKFLGKFGFGILDNSYTMPGDAASINDMILDFNKTVPLEQRIHIGFYDADGLVSDLDTMRHWAYEGKLPFSALEEYHFHDLNTHFVGYSAMPPEYIAVSRNNASLYLAILDDPILSRHSGLTSFANERLNKMVNGLDSTADYTYFKSRNAFYIGLENMVGTGLKQDGFNLFHPKNATDRWIERVYGSRIDALNDMFATTDHFGSIAEQRVKDFDRNLPNASDSRPARSTRTDGDIPDTTPVPVDLSKGLVRTGLKVFGGVLAIFDLASTAKLAADNKDDYLEKVIKNVDNVKNSGGLWERYGHAVIGNNDRSIDVYTLGVAADPAVNSQPGAAAINAYDGVIDSATQSIINTVGNGYKTFCTVTLSCGD